MIRLSNIKFNKLPANDEVFAKAIRTLRLDKADIETMQISKHSIDARKKDSIKYVYSVDIKVSDYVENKLLNLKDVSVVKEYKYEADKIDTDEKVVIIGAGPSGLFLALTLIESGVKPIIIERGKRIEEREEDVNKLMENGIFDENSNIVFGEGGAGTFSDGKLTTGVKDKRKAYILDQFVRFGANEEIKYVTKPHIGTDVIRNVVKNIRNFIIDNGGEFLFSTMMTDILVDRDKVKGVILKNPKEEFSLECDTVCLCTGHSSHETFEMLYSKNVNLESKPLAVGVRIEHRREFINISQYGADYNKNLPTAEYKLAVKTNNGRNCYTFCMCPGGVVVPSMSNKNGIVVNGMSYYKRDKDNSNSAILVNVTPDDYIKYTKNDTPLSGIYFQKDLEEKAFELGGGDYNAPAQLVKDFLNDSKSKSIGEVEPSYKPNYKLSNINEILPEFLRDGLKSGILQMDKKIKGFKDNDSVITAIETRSSSPVRITRDENLETNIKGLFAVGEGSGYAGGITSSCIDGVKCAEKVVEKLR